jgi:hypothetical protein
LLAVGQIDHLERLLAGMGRCEGDVTCGVPVLRHHDIGKTLGDAIDHGNDLLAVLHRETAAGQEAILNIDDQQRRRVIDLDGSGSPK